MNSLACAAALCATASAFVTPNTLRTSVSPSSGMTMSAKSKSLPFMPQPAKLDGTMAGDVGFDPIGFSDFIPLDFLREAELKHGRICQLAVVGFITTDLGIHLPGAVHEVGSVAAHDVAVASGAMPQILMFITVLEAVSTVAVIQMLEGSGRVPGYFGFDPLKLYEGGKDKKKADMELKEVTHCRLAMLAFSGMVTQAVLTNSGFPYTG